ncbi:MAG: LytTR family DNA-binding domain-containing protein [Bryobacteraceae bacterium]|nr:LytTR family DNA-binding domain-containing protein [Bryobacteraceae bacterium]
MLTAFVVDDEPLAVARLARMLSETGRVAVAGTSTDPVEAVAAIRQSGCDVLFLDIEMPGYNGFQLLEALGAQDQPLVVFTTAFSQYALQAFEVNSIAYLLKPVEAAALDRAIDKIERIRGGLSPRPRMEELLERLQAALPAVSTYPDRLPSRLGEKIEFVEVARVTHFFASEKLTFAATPQRNFVLDSTIAELEARLDPRKFLRIHRSTIVNVDYVQELHSWFGGKMMVRLKDPRKSELTVARDRLKALKERLGV